MLEPTDGRTDGRIAGKRAEEGTVGITQFMSDDTSVVSGVLKQRYSDFIVREVRQKVPEGQQPSMYSS